MRSNLVSVTTSQSESEHEVALVIGDIPSHKLEQNIITRVVSAEMVANALLCDRGRSCTVLPEAGLHPTRFWINGLSGRTTGSRGITGKESQSHAS